MNNSIKYLLPLYVRKLFWLSLINSFLIISCNKEKEIMQLAPESKLPIANAGRDTIVALSTNSLFLDGSASFDPDGSITKYEWTKLSGPDSATITTNTNTLPAKVLVQNLAAGYYVFQLNVTDNGGLSAQDFVNVFIHNNEKEFLFENLTWQIYKPDNSSVWDEIFVHTPARPELFSNAFPLGYNPYFKADVYLKFESSSSWVQINSAYFTNSKIPVNPYTYVVSEPYLSIHSYPLDYELVGKKVSIIIKF